MKLYPRYCRLFIAWLLAALGLGLPVAEAAYTCSIKSPEFSHTWTHKVPVIYDNLPIGSVLMERPIKVSITFAKSTPGRENYKIAGHWDNKGFVLPAPALALPAWGTATGGGQLNGLGMRFSKQNGQIFYDEQTITEGSFEENLHTISVTVLQQIVKVDNNFTQGGHLMYAAGSNFLVGPRPQVLCEVMPLTQTLFVDVPTPVKPTCTLATKDLGVQWPGLLLSEMPLNVLSHKRTVEILLTNCAKGAKPFIHFASYKDLARGEVRNPVADKESGTVIDGLSIRLKNPRNGADIRFGNPAAILGDAAVGFSMGTTTGDNAFLAQPIDVYLERTKAQVRLGGWISQASFIISYP